VDLQPFRRKVSDAIRRAGHDDIAMEYYVAEDKRPVDRCVEDVSRCDVYIGIFAWRRGWVPSSENPDQLSITELEYRKAFTSGKTCLIFILDPAVPWPPAWVDDNKRRMSEFRDSLAEQQREGHRAPARSRA